MKVKFLMVLFDGIVGALLLPIQHDLALCFFAVSVVVTVNMIWTLLFNSSGTQNPSIFTRAERDRVRPQIIALCGHGLIREVIGQEDTYECNGIRFEIVGDTVVEVR